MLVLERRVGESVMIGDDIVVTLEKIKSSECVRLSFKAPRHIIIHRQEVYDNIQKEQHANDHETKTAGQ